MITTTDILKQSKNILNYPSSIRDGKLRKLSLGEMAVHYNTTDRKARSIVSTREGCQVVNIPAEGRCFIETFIIAKNFQIEPGEGLPNIDKIKNEFSRHEVSEVMKRIKNVDEVVYAPNPEIERLQKFFDNVGKKVAVLPDGKIVELDSNFTLLVRSDASLETAMDEATKTMHLVMWEDVGFAYEYSAT